MRLAVDLTPNPPYADETIVAVDVLRATTSIGMLLEKGAREVWVARSARAALAWAGADDLLLGEKEGLPPEGFHHGTSPAALARLEVRGRRVVYTSDHLPALLERLKRSQGVWLGSLRNAPSLVEQLRTSAPEAVRFVCAGFRGAEALDDALAAGLFVRALQGAREITELEGAARICTALFDRFSHPLEGLVASASGRFLRSMGFEDDLATAARVGADRTVPKLAGSELTAAGPLFRFLPVP